MDKKWLYTVLLLMASAIGLHAQEIVLGTLASAIDNAYIRLWLHIYATKGNTGHIGRRLIDWG